MPKFVIERQYLVPMYQHIVVEAENLGDACNIEGHQRRYWLRHPGDGLRQRSRDTISAAKSVSEGYEADKAHSLTVASRDPRGLPLDMLSLATFLCEDEAKTGRLLEIPAKFTEDE
jgi:hypothetical protein